MKNLRLNVFAQTTTNYQLRFMDEKDTLIHARDISAQALSDFISQSLQHYATGIQLETLGKAIFTWLNGSESVLNGYHQDTQLHIDCNHDLENLAWELLHHDNHYLCANQHQPFTPIRLVATGQTNDNPANRPLRLLFMASSPEHIQPVLKFEAEESLILKATRKQQ